MALGGGKGKTARQCLVIGIPTREMEERMTLTDVKTLTEIGALALAGGWAVYGFLVLKQRQKAAADLREAEANARQAEQGARAIAVISAAMTLSAARNPTGTGYCILAEVSLVNEGRRDTRISWDGEAPALSVHRVEFDGGVPRFPGPPIEVTVRQTGCPNENAVSHVIRSGGTERLTFAACVADEGLYLVSFQGALAKTELPVALAAGADTHNPCCWSVGKYVIVRDSVGCGTGAVNP